MGKEMKRWKFRAECTIDVARWILGVHETDYKLVGLHVVPCGPHGDVEVEFATDDHQGLAGPMRAVVDGHVMCETLATADRYTGERSAVRTSGRPREEQKPST